MQAAFARPNFEDLEAVPCAHHRLLRAYCVPLILFNALSNPVRPSLHAHWTERSREGKSPRVWGPCSQRRPPSPPRRDQAANWVPSPCRPPAEPRKGTGQGLSGDREGIPGTPPHPKVRAVSRAGNPARAPKRGAAAGKSGEKLLLFFSFLALALPPPPSPTPRRSPPRGAPPPRLALRPSPPAANRRAPLARLCGLTNRGGGRAARATPPFAQFYKRRRLWPRAQIAEVQDARLSSFATWIIAGTLHNSFRLAWEGFAPFRRSWTRARASWEGFGFSGCRFCVFSRGIVVERFPLWIITAP